MTELATYQQSRLPGTLEDLSRFVLVGREKLTSVRAAIRAIDKVQLAQEVRDQKMEEARMLSEALLDAEVRLGEMTKQIPRATKGNQYTGKMVTDSGVDNQAHGRIFNLDPLAGLGSLQTGWVGVSPGFDGMGRKQEAKFITNRSCPEQNQDTTAEG